MSCQNFYIPFKSIPVPPTPRLFSGCKHSYSFYHLVPQEAQYSAIHPFFTQGQGWGCPALYYPKVPRCILLQIVEWHLCRLTKLWTRTKEDLIPLDLISLLWTDTILRPSKDLLPTLVSATLLIWDGYLGQRLLFPRPSPLTPLFRLASFPQHWLVLPSFRSTSKEVTTLYCFICWVGEPSYPCLKFSQTAITPGWPGLNTRNYNITLNSSPPQTYWRGSFESLLSRFNRPDHSLTQIYQILLR